jgi:hypothetical protein
VPPPEAAGLAAAAAALSVGVGFLPVSGAVAGLGPVATGATVSLLAACAAVVQPRAGRALDSGRITSGSGVAAGLLITAAGLALAMLPGNPWPAAGRRHHRRRDRHRHPLAFAALAAATPQERLGQTLGAAELGRELGDAGGPLLVAGVAAVTTLTGGFAALGGRDRRRERRSRTPSQAGSGRRHRRRIVSRGRPG